MDDTAATRPASPAGDFSNVGRTGWWRRGFFASQTAYVAGALIVIMVVMALLSPAFLSAGNPRERGEESSPSSAS